MIKGLLEISMTDLDLNSILLDSLMTYGSPALGLALLLGAVGLPLPTTLMVVAAGALARQGIVDWSTAFGLGLLGAALGDNASYAIGRWGRSWVQGRFRQSEIWRKAQVYFEQKGALAIFLTRCLVMPLAIPTNLIAGSSGYSFRQFFTYDIAGELTWLLLFGGLGYAFGTQWQLVSQAIGDYGVWIGGAIAAAIGLYYVICRVRSINWANVDRQIVFQR
jgi:membrane-associated protein